MLNWFPAAPLAYSLFALEYLAPFLFPLLRVEICPVFFFVDWWEVAHVRSSDFCMCSACRMRGPRNTPCLPQKGIGSLSSSCAG